MAAKCGIGSVGISVDEYKAIENGSSRDLVKQNAAYICARLQISMNEIGVECFEVADIDDIDEQSATITPQEVNNMSYQKPQLIAKSEPKQSYVGGCPVNGRGSDDDRHRVSDAGKERSRGQHDGRSRRRGQTPPHKMRRELRCRGEGRREVWIA